MNPHPESPVAQALNEALERHIFQVWYPRCVDTEYGGYLSNFAFDWAPLPHQEKMVVSQARHLWTLSRAYAFDPSRPEFLQWAAHGFRFLQDTLPDREYGGYQFMVSREGKPVVVEDEFTTKTAYGHAFLIYALSAFYRVSRNEEALQAAKACFHWLETHAHDPQHGGYFQFLDIDGTPFRDGHNGAPPKDQNSMIHTLEAFTELYQVWPDPLVRTRLEECLTLIRDTIVHPEGSLQLCFEQDWTPISHRSKGRDFVLAHIHTDHVTLGHDVETAFLLHEALEALGMPDDSGTWSVAKRLVDHALTKGWNPDSPGFPDQAYYFAGEDALTTVLPSKNWWTQVEAMNTFLLMAKRFPDDPLHYGDRFLEMWQFIQDHLIDHEHGGLFEWATDIDQGKAGAPKGHIWKAAYHDGRAFMNCVTMLQPSGYSSS